MSPRVTEEWMGEQVKTLEDLLRPGLRAVCVGINPTPKSVAAGHYYQGRFGQMLFERLRVAGVIGPGRWEDDLAFEQGVGFTDIVKRPTANEKEIRSEEYAHGRPLLVAKVEECAPGLVIFAFKKTAEVLFGKFHGNGFIEGLKVGGAPIFVMPGPFAARKQVAEKLDQLRRWWIS